MFISSARFALRFFTVFFFSAFCFTISLGFCILLGYTKDELIGKIKILLAGKAAEEIIFNHLSTGAKDDLKKVTDIADQMVCEYGMSNLGFMTIEGNSKSFMSDKVQKEANA